MTHSFFFSPHADGLKQTLELGDAPFTPKHEILSVGTEVTQLDVGIFRFEPNTACTESIVISVGVHGDETAPIEVVNRLIIDLLAEDQKCSQRVLFVFANPLAMKAGQRFISANMNRLFCGQWQYEDLSLPEVKRVAKIEAYVANFLAEEPVTVTTRYHLDAHTSIHSSHHEQFAITPINDEATLPERLIQIASACGVSALIRQPNPANSFNAFTTKTQNAIGLTLELGTVNPWGENSAHQTISFDKTIRALIAGETLPKAINGPLTYFEVAQVITNSGDGFEMNLANDHQNFDAFEPGDWVYKDNNQQYIVNESAEYCVFANPKVGFDERAGLLLRKVTQ